MKSLRSKGSPYRIRINGEQPRSLPRSDESVLGCCLMVRTVTLRRHTLESLQQVSLIWITPMQTRQDDWISRWTDYEGEPEYELRLRAALHTKAGRSLLHWMRERGIPEDGLAFAFVELVCEMKFIREETRGVHIPNKKKLKKGCSVLLAAARWLRDNALGMDLTRVKRPPNHKEGEVIQGPPQVVDICQTLEECADNLKRREFLWYPPDFILELRRSDYERFQVTTFLRAYFAIEGDESRRRWDRIKTWKPIADFLIMAKLNPKRPASLWNNVWRRKGRPAPGEAVKIKYHTDMYMSFLRAKAKVYGQPWKDISAEVHEKLRKLFTKERRARA
jgi:hypothetical protein